jgi:type IV secretory pathway protease TraF
MTTTTVPRPRRRRWVTPRDYGFLGVVFALLISTQWFTINISPSVPVGLYRFVAIDAPLQHGDLLHLPAVRFGHSWFYRQFIPLLKPVAGVPGDLACVQPEGLWVQGEPYGAVYQEHRGKPLPVFWGCHVVGAGEVFVASHEPMSLDGRYFGMTRVAEARRVVPLWTWR